MKTMEDRFWEKVNKNGPIPQHRPELGQCWVWIGAIQGAGYGNFVFNGKVCLSHRVSYEINREPIGDGISALHKCDNRPCVRPDHLFLGTIADNNRDCREKGRAKNPIAEKNGAKTHCVKGHDYAIVGFYVSKGGPRRCKECYREHAKSYRHKNIELVRERDKKRRPRMTTGENLSGRPRRY